VTGKRVLKRLLITSVSQARIREDIAMRSAAGNFCSPDEARTCFWGGQQWHPDDLRVCEVTGLTIHFRFVTSEGPARLRPLLEILDGATRPADATVKWDEIAPKLSAALGDLHARIEASVLSPSQKALAVSAEAKKKYLGLRVYHVGAVYDMANSAIAGRPARGRRGPRGWKAQ
jgi:hypothetical protein